jgi:hypothetical protein
MRRLVLTSLLAVALLAVPAQAEDKQPWATVNVCDTRAHEGEIGIRASMPRARGRTRTIRFRVQYRDLSDGRWRYVRDADSGWQRVRRAAESGWSFEVAGTGEPILRGVVFYRWARKGAVVRRERRVTEGGHRSTVGADPEDFSAATCRIDA